MIDHLQFILSWLTFPENATKREQKHAPWQVISTDSRTKAEALYNNSVVKWMET